ncbi:hypothetical protein N9W57_02940 [Pseudomonadales bacterium]|nr:hypothetical protein [Pseudomonadales bacterium]
MNKYRDFLDDFTDRAYEKINTYYDLNSFEHAIKASISIDIVIFLIEILNSNESKNSEYIINNFVSAIEVRCNPSAQCNIRDMTSSRHQAASVLSKIHTGGSIDEAASSSYLVKDLAPLLYNVRVQEYFSKKEPAIMVISAMVNELINNINGIETSMELITEINELFIQCATKVPTLVDSSSKMSTRTPSDNDKCYVVTAASGSKDSDLVRFYREYRDEVLIRTKIGRNLIRFYYKKSPPLAKSIENNQLLKWVSLRLLVSIRYLINFIWK